MFNTVDQLHPIFFKFALANYQASLEVTTKKEADGSLNADESNEHDERWLCHLMQGKLSEKQKEPLMTSLEEYVKAIQNLIGKVH